MELHCFLLFRFVIILNAPRDLFLTVTFVRPVLYRIVKSVLHRKNNTVILPIKIIVQAHLVISSAVYRIPFLSLTAFKTSIFHMVIAVPLP